MATHARSSAPDLRAGPDTPADLDRAGWTGALRRTVSEFREDNLTDWAAALTYYAIQAIFPALLVLVSLLGLAGRETTQTLIDNVAGVAPGPAREIVMSAVENLQESQGTAGLLLVVGIAGALFSASGYIGAFTRASNAIYEVEEGRPFWKLRPQQMLITVVLVALLSVSALAVVITGGLAEQVGNLLGLGDTAVTVWDIAKWPVLLVLVSLMFAILYWAAPNVRQPGFSWLSPGGLLAVVIWLLASLGFAFYVANFGNYNKTYGSLGGVVIFLVWLWISNVAVLLGAEFNAELARSKTIAEGGPRDAEPILEPRDPKEEKDAD
jgi:membrane protein